MISALIVEKSKSFIKSKSMIPPWYCRHDEIYIFFMEYRWFYMLVILFPILNYSVIIFIFDFNISFLQ
ncbi:hypothetical protein B4923_02800 [Brenneria roseae subsp. americana]|uniref:Uncharacterized protein n=1 Tax=Brenneria roseae subsp. americana TaxID=1508507 RepID=A0A2U1U012_9GAMM|nr:hypothetical protein B4923_02800 [Brenneria roseae subsp. americana]